MQVVYQTAAVATGDGRNGRARTTDGLLDVELATPPEFGGTGGATNPEQLFAAGYAACFHSALRSAARRAGVALDGSSVTAEIGLASSGGGLELRARLAAALPGVDPATARELLDQAHSSCPYSKALRGNVDVELTVG